MNGAPASLARRREISVLPTPVGPIIRMFLGKTSSRSFSSSCRRRQRLRNAIATARLASAWPMMKRSSSETISRGEKSVMEALIWSLLHAKAMALPWGLIGCDNERRSSRPAAAQLKFLDRDVAVGVDTDIG